MGLRTHARGLVTNGEGREALGCVAATVNGQTLTLLDVLRHAQTTTRLAFLQDAIKGAIVDQAIAREAIAATDAEVEAVLARFRSEHELADAADFDGWLARHRMTLAALRAELARGIAFGKLKGRVTAELDPLLARGAFSVEHEAKLRDVLFLHWIETELARAAIDAPLEHLLAG
jgi:hypothetical protein